MRLFYWKLQRFAEFSNFFLCGLATLRLCVKYLRLFSSYFILERCLMINMPNRLIDILHHFDWENRIEIFSRPIRFIGRNNARINRLNLCVSPQLAVEQKELKCRKVIFLKSADIRPRGIGRQRNLGFLRAQRYFDGSVYIGLGAATALTGTGKK